MRAVLGLLLLAGCATLGPSKKDPVVEPKPGPPLVGVCPTSAVPWSEAESALGVIVEKVCLVGASEDSYLRLHELVAPREGNVVDASMVRADIELMFEQHLLRDVVVVAQPLASKSVMLTYVVSEYEWITQIEYTGVHAVNVEDFKELAHSGIRANPFLLKTLTETVKALYAGLGYPAAKATATVKSLGGGNAKLTLAIDEGEQVKVGAVSFEGTRQLPEAELRKVIGSSTGQPYLQELAERDTLAITTVYFDYGMVNVAVATSTRALVAPPGAVEVVFQVKEGDVFRLGRVKLTGFSLGVEKDVLKGMEARPGSVFSRAVLQRDMEKLKARAQLQGHAVEIIPQTTVDPEKKTIDVSFELEKKPSGTIRF
ncbi:MAG: POTRA domain-containing protein [Archangium sp.]|nr:POTRA domain-containing protein [Archangium sp.]MDP3156553.1 POTRA domain-containing protein [Archangium sp.]MDP3573896.1 POTRA domain-containing protein [Archangium sp.]